MKIIHETKYLKFVDTEDTSRKTKIISVINTHHDEVLGEIEWFAKWRQYCFYPHENTIWNINCLEDVNNVIKQLKIEHLLASKVRKKYKTIGVISYNIQDFIEWKKQQKPQKVNFGATERIYIYRNKRYICLTEKNNVRGFNYDDIIETAQAYLNPDYDEIVGLTKAYLIVKPLIKYYQQYP